VPNVARARLATRQMLCIWAGETWYSLPFDTGWFTNDRTLMTRTRTLSLAHWIAIPDGAESPIGAFVNGTERAEGDGIRIEDGRIYFDPPLRVPLGTSFGAKLLLSFGVGVYGDLKGDALDLQFMRNGVTEWVTNVPFTATGEGQ